MPVRAMTQEEVERFLVEQRVVRVCAHVRDQLYLIPFGYIWLEGNLYGGTISKRLTEMVQQNPHVAFQIDDYAHATGPWAYRSLTGQGDFACLGDAAEIERIAPVLRVRFADAPAWFQQEQAALVNAARMRFWRLHPVEMTGRMHAPGEQI
jgi:nitroimidazol reductase NimA-like FMN-containing flavoprotein (pyridoxamine 5'-phosphate oxidase superfamily)